MKKFVIATFDIKYETYVIYIATLNINLSNKIYLLKKT